MSTGDRGPSFSRHAYFVTLGRMREPLNGFADKKLDQHAVTRLTNALVLFTAPDSMAALLGKLGPAGAAMQTGQTTGARVFPHIAQMRVDGVVINPMGPGARRVLRLADLT